jgi:hypothetical protein
VGENTLAESCMASQRYNFGMALKEVIALIDAEIARSSLPVQRSP